MTAILKKIGYTLLALAVFAIPFSAQSSRWSDLRGKSVLAFDWNCAQTKLFPKRALQRRVPRAIPVRDHGQSWGDRAFTLKFGGNTTYFVPLVCGATGNCSWRLYTLKPTTYLGNLSGEYIYTYESQRVWPTIITYTHMSVSEGILTTYRFRNGRYRQVGGEYATSARGSDTSDFELETHPTPKELDKIQIMCRDYGR